MKVRALFVLLMLLSANLCAEETKTDPWQAVRFLVGHWEGTVSGEAGDGKVSRSYEFVLNDKFIHEQNTSTYPPQPKNEKGEVHHHLSFLSYDRERETLMLRQFHQEGFINLYALNPSASSATLLVFESERFENFNNAWKAKETYEVVSHDEFIETFELAPPGKAFAVYSRNHFKRAPAAAKVSGADAEVAKLGK